MKSLNRRNFLRTFGLGAAGTMLPRWLRSDISRRPNIIFILADDLGYGDLGCYGQEKIRTPHLDKMAEEGIRFTQFYAGNTVCAPSRCSFLTGKHPGHALVRGNVSWKPRGDVPLRADEPSLGKVMKAAGYNTGVFGKWGQGLKNTSGAPHRQGFDEFLGFEDQSEAHYYYVDTLQTIRDGQTMDISVDEDTYTHDLFVDATLDFIDRHKSESFFLYVPFTIPHAELVVPEDSLNQYKGKFPEIPYEGNTGYPPNKWPRATYAGMVSRMDAGIGQIRDRLEQYDIDENTIIIFTSDNGPEKGPKHGCDPEFFNSTGPFRGVKRDMYEGALRVPMIVWGPSNIPMGKVDDTIAAGWDILPTIVELGGAKIPDNIDGISLVNTIQGKPQWQHEYLYWENWEKHAQGVLRAIRRNRWKAIESQSAEGIQRFELYDLQTDIGEQTDLADTYPGIAEDMKSLMKEAHRPSEQPDFQSKWPLK